MRWGRTPCNSTFACHASAMARAAARSRRAVQASSGDLLAARAKGRWVALPAMRLLPATRAPWHVPPLGPVERRRRAVATYLPWGQMPDALGSHTLHLDFCLPCERHGTCRRSVPSSGAGEQWILTCRTGTSAWAVERSFASARRALRCSAPDSPSTRRSLFRCSPLPRFRPRDKRSESCLYDC